MAPGKRAMKEVAAQTCAKRQRREPRKKDLGPESRHQVKTALRQASAEVLPSSEARDMLLASVDFALTGESEERHRFQKTAAAMIGEVLVGIRGQLEQAVEAKKNAVDEAQDKKASLEQDLQSLEQALEAKKAEIQAKKELKTTDEKALKESVTGMEKTKAHARELQAKRDAAKGDQLKLTGIYEGCFQKLRDQPPSGKKEGEKLLKSLTQMLTTMKADVSMLNGLPAAILKPLDQRGEFDQMAIQAVDRLFSKAFQEKEQLLAGHDEEVRQGEETQQEAQQAVEAATSKLEETVQLLKQAEDERKEGEKSLKVQTLALRKHVEKTVEDADQELKTSEANSRNFAKVEEAFAYLQSYTMKAPPQVQEEEAPMQEEECEEDMEEQQHFAEEAALPVKAA